MLFLRNLRLFEKSRNTRLIIVRSTQEAQALLTLYQKLGNRLNLSDLPPLLIENLDLQPIVPLIALSNLSPVRPDPSPEQAIHTLIEDVDRYQRRTDLSMLPISQALQFALTSTPTELVMRHHAQRLIYVPNSTYQTFVPVSFHQNIMGITLAKDNLNQKIWPKGLHLFRIQDKLTEDQLNTILNEIERPTHIDAFQDIVNLFPTAEHLWHAEMPHDALSSPYSLLQQHMLLMQIQLKSNNSAYLTSNQINASALSRYEALRESARSDALNETLSLILSPEKNLAILSHTILELYIEHLEAKQEPENKKIIEFLKSASQHNWILSSFPRSSSSYQFVHEKPKL